VGIANKFFPPFIPRQNCSQPLNFHQVPWELLSTTIYVKTAKIGLGLHTFGPYWSIFVHSGPFLFILSLILNKKSSLVFGPMGRFWCVCQLKSKMKMF
jgi:hypothetical protein